MHQSKAPSGCLEERLIIERVVDQGLKAWVPSQRLESWDMPNMRERDNCGQMLEFGQPS
jgi:hypothetical protein